MKRAMLVLAAGGVLNFCAAQDRVNCPGDYKGHLQGIVRDDQGNIFWSFTTVLVKTDSGGKETGRVDVPNHYGDLTFHNGKVYVAVNHGKFNQEPGAADSWVYVHDAATLALLGKHAVPEAVHGAGGMEWHAGKFYVVGGLPATHEDNYVYEYTEDFKFVKRHVIESGQTFLGIQTVCRGNDGTWWFGCYGRPAVTLRADDSFRFLGKHVYNSAVGITRSADGSTLLIGRNSRDKESKRNTGWAVIVRKEDIIAK